MIAQRDYHDKKEEVTWETSNIRSFLNQEFYQQFNEDEKNQILSVVTSNLNNHWYKTSAGNQTIDKIFLLSLEEVAKHYFKDSSQLLDFPKTNQRYWFDRKDINNIKRRSKYMDQAWWWWTRTPGKNQKTAVYIHGDGNIGIQGNGVSKTTFNTVTH